MLPGNHVLRPELQRQIQSVERLMKKGE
jgi:hypothetical protein